MRVTLCGLVTVLCWLTPVPTIAVEYKWTQVQNPAAFAPRDGAEAVAFNNQMYLLGGWNPSDNVHFPTDTTNEVWKTTGGANWSLVNHAPWEQRHGFGSVVYNNKMWILGGDPIQGHYQPDVWSTSNGVDWTQVSANTPWGQRYCPYSLVHDNKIFVMGGQTMPQFIDGGGTDVIYNDVWSSTDGENWTQVTAAAPWSPRGFIFGHVSFQGRMWILGGGTYDTPDHPTRQYYNDVWSSADGLNWRQDLAAAPWAAREMHNVAVFDDKMWVMEGYDGTSNGNGNRNDVWYSADGVHWTEVPNTPWAPRHAASAVVYDNALWMITGNNMQSDVWRLDAIHTPEPTTGHLLGAGLLALGGWRSIHRKHH